MLRRLWVVLSVVLGLLLSGVAAEPVWSATSGQGRDLEGRTVGRGGLPFVIGEGPEIRDPVVVDSATDDGVFLVVWPDASTGTRQVWGRWVTLGGQVAGGPFRISQGDDAVSDIDVAYDWVTNQFLVVWGETNGDGSEVAGRRVSPVTRRPVRKEFMIGSGGGGFDALGVAFGGDRGWLVVWADEDGAEEGQAINGQRVRSNGRLAGGKIEIAPALPGSLGVASPSVAYGPANHTYLVVWSDGRSGSQVDIYGQRVRTSGRLVGGNFPVSPYSQDAAVAYNGDVNEFFVVFMAADDVAIRGQRVAVSGRLRGKSRGISRDPSGEFWDWFPSISPSFWKGAYAVTWAHDNAGPSFDGTLYVRYIDALGRPTTKPRQVAHLENPSQVRSDIASAFMLPQEIVVWNDWVADRILGRVYP